jgi:hypothetical protein
MRNANSICKVCNKYFYSRPLQTFFGKTTYCSAKCRHDDTRLKIRCFKCKKEFYTNKTNNTRKYCSNKCYYEARSEIYIQEKNPNWKNGTLTKFGYKLIYKKGKQVREHRNIIENYLGRKLKKEEVIHHINGIKYDNRIENLKLIKNQSKHRRLHLCC